VQNLLRTIITMFGIEIVLSGKGDVWEGSLLTHSQLLERLKCESK
jgi:hypothetical protein